MPKWSLIERSLFAPSARRQHVHDQQAPLPASRLPQLGWRRRQRGEGSGCQHRDSRGLALTAAVTSLLTEAAVTIQGRGVLVLAGDVSLEAPRAGSFGQMRCRRDAYRGIVFAGDRGPATRPAFCELPLSSSTDRTDRSGTAGVAIGDSQRSPISLVWLSNSFKNPLDSPGRAS